MRPCAVLYCRISYNAERLSPGQLSRNEVRMKLSDLRQAAIHALDQGAVDWDDYHENQSSQELIHELRVYQAELETQNEELRRVQSELEASRDKFIGLFDWAPVGYLTVNAAGRIVDANLTVAKLLGVERGKLSGTALASYVAVEDSGELHRHLRNIAQNDQTATCELKLRNSSARLIDVRLNSSCVGETTRRIAVVDLGETVNLLRAKLDSDERLRVISHVLSVPIAYVDRSGTYRMHNAAHQAWSGNSVVGRDARACFSDENYQIVQRQITRVLDGQSGSCHLQLDSDEAGTRVVEMCLAPHRDADDNVIGFYEVLQDLTLQQQVEEAEAQRAMLLAQLQDLPKTHRVIFDLLMAGRSNKRIATDLEIGSRTVERARHDILKQLNVESINELLVRFAPVALPDATDAPR